MSYEPTVWKPGDKITSRRMNKLEEGLAGVETGGVYLVKNLDETVEGKALDATVGPGIRDRLTALESASSVVLEGRVDQLEDDLATTNGNVSTLSSNLNTTNTNVSALDTNIQGVANRVTTVESDISDINDAMAVPTWDSAEETITFTSDDDAQGNATSWTSVPLIESGEKHKSIFNKFTTMVKNIRYLYNMLGTTDISSIGSGTVTSALGNLNTRVGTLNDANASSNTRIGYLESYVSQMRNIQTLSIELANSDVISHTAGQAKFFQINTNTGIAFFTLAFRTTEQRPAGLGVFRLKLGSKYLVIDEPYNLVCTVGDSTHRFSGYTQDGSRRWINSPAQWTANSEFRITGVAFCNIVD